MKNGISRYTLGSFNQTALDDVYNKAKEIYVAPVAPPSSGVVLNTIDQIWEDMTTTAEVSAPCTAAEFNKGPVWKNGDYTPPPEGTGIIRDPDNISDGYNPGPPGSLTNCSTWRRCNIWIEVEEDAGNPVKWCAPTINQATNTIVEVAGLWNAWLDDNGVWHKLLSDHKEFNGGRFPKEIMNYSALRGCTEEAWQVYEDIRQQYPNYDPVYGTNEDGNWLIRPAHYWRTHIWAAPSVNVPELLPTPPGQMVGYYTCSWARLVLVDPNGVDDRHLARYIWHVSGDAKQEDGTSACYSDIGGISKYKLVPQNGDWVSINMLVGNITEEMFRNNPPPFPTTP